MTADTGNPYRYSVSVAMNEIETTKNEIAHKMKKLNVPTHSKFWKRLSYTVDRPPDDYQSSSKLPSHLDQLLRAHLRNLWQEVCNNPLPIQTPFPDTHRSFHITVESLHYLCSRHSKNL